MSTELKAGEGQVRQVVSYLTLKNVSLDSKGGGINPNDFRFLDKNGNLLNLNQGADPAGAATIDWNSTAPAIDAEANWGPEFMLLWLLLLLLVPILIAVMCCCLSRKENDDATYATLMEKDWEAGRTSYDQHSQQAAANVFGENAKCSVPD